MAKKSAVKKSARKSAKSSSKSKINNSIAKLKSASVKKSSKQKKVLKKDQKESLLKQANLIANSEKKLKLKRQKKAGVPKTSANSLLNSVIEGMKNKKAKNITLLNLSKLENRIADFFVICDADSTTHVDAIANSVEETVIKQCAEKPYHSEGYQNSQWILIDYINVVAHVFLKEIREYYNIEGLWGDAEVKTIH